MAFLRTAVCFTIHILFYSFLEGALIRGSELRGLGQQTTSSRLVPIDSGLDSIERDMFNISVAEMVHSETRIVALQNTLRKLRDKWENTKPNATMYTSDNEPPFDSSKWMGLLGKPALLRQVLRRLRKRLRKASRRVKPRRRIPWERVFRAGKGPFRLNPKSGEEGGQFRQVKTSSLVSKSLSALQNTGEYQVRGLRPTKSPKRLCKRLKRANKPVAKKRGRMKTISLEGTWGSFGSVGKVAKPEVTTLSIPTDRSVEVGSWAPISSGANARALGLFWAPVNRALANPQGGKEDGFATEVSITRGDSLGHDQRQTITNSEGLSVMSRGDQSTTGLSSESKNSDVTLPRVVNTASPRHAFSKTADNLKSEMEESAEWYDEPFSEDQLGVVMTPDQNLPGEGEDTETAAGEFEEFIC